MKADVSDGCWLLAACWWMLAAAVHWLIALGCWVLDVDCCCCLSLAVDCWLLVAGCWLLDVHARFPCLVSCRKREKVAHCTAQNKPKRFKQPYFSGTATHEPTNTSKHFLFLPVKREQG